MVIDILGFDHVHLLGDPATHSPVPCSPRQAVLLRLAGMEPASLSRLAWHADHGTGERVQLPFPG
jgi:hypothetical protein